jgi:hypothetical protein
MNRVLVVVLLVVGVMAATHSNAASRDEVCVKYEKEYGWSKGYAVEATIISGSDLNSAVGSFSRFRAFGTYAVVFWSQDQATILELPPMSMGSAPMFETQVRDQEGRAWKIKQGHFLCQ